MDDPRRTLLAIRRFEILAGALSVACGLALWGEGGWHWLLIACGLVGLSPYPARRRSCGAPGHTPRCSTTIASAGTGAECAASRCSFPPTP
jgi:hypothetical protein